MYLSSLITSLVALPFAIFSTPGCLSSSHASLGVARGWLHGLFISFCLLLSLCSLISLYLSSLITSLVVYGLKLKLWFLGGWLLFSPTQSFVILRWHECLVSACLVCEVLLIS
ncbi:hypothetical protein F2Q70_00001952 [Brassica cretica]|uniref:Uncharacterized protein n=1 Tax=Brassica cretica TaxID=69181 RepID=A0A8S9IV43_BRACR|nr:hypothetical protein F2Q70_00001952 [Brassica cretica]